MTVHDRPFGGGAVPTFLWKLAEQEQWELVDEFTHTFQEKIIVCHEGGKGEHAETLCRERLFDSKESPSVAKCTYDEVVIRQGQFRVSFDVRRDERDGYPCPSIEGWAIHLPTDTEFTVESSLYDIEIDEALAELHKGEPAGAAAKDAWRRSRGI